MANNDTPKQPITPTTENRMVVRQGVEYRGEGDRKVTPPPRPNPQPPKKE